MTPEWLSRSELLLGEEGLKSLSSSHLLVVGLGGVGGFVVEALARAGIYNIDIIDNDDISITNTYIHTMYCKYWTNSLAFIGVLFITPLFLSKIKFNLI